MHYYSHYSHSHITHTQTLLTLTHYSHSHITRTHTLLTLTYYSHSHITHTHTLLTLTHCSHSHITHTHTLLTLTHYSHITHIMLAICFYHSTCVLFNPNPNPNPNPALFILHVYFYLFLLIAVCLHHSTGSPRDSSHSLDWIETIRPYSKWSRVTSLQAFMDACTYGNDWQPVSCHVTLPLSRHPWTVSLRMRSWQVRMRCKGILHTTRAPW